MNMKKIFALLVFALVISACSTKPEIIDNGNPGQIKVFVFLDANRNGVKDPGEPGVVDQVSISQDISCPAGNIDKVTIAETNSDGETLYEDLQPGIYCVAYMGGKSVTTKLTVEVSLSSDQIAQVAFGLPAE